MLFEKVVVNGKSFDIEYNGQKATYRGELIDGYGVLEKDSEGKFFGYERAIDVPNSRETLEKLHNIIKTKINSGL